MISNNLEDYEVLSILGADLNSTCYKVKNKSTSEIFVWKAISYENITESEKNSLLAQIEKQKLQAHPHIVQVYDYIVQEDTKIIYLISEFCANGNLTGLIHKCLIENEYLSENFLWRILYQIACTLKITGNLTQSLTLSSVFVDVNYTVKLFNNDMLKPEVHDCDHLQSQNAYFGIIMFELCTLQLQKLASKSSVATTKQILTDIPSYYSNEFKEIIRFTLSTNFDLNAILCHPTILLKSTQVPQNIFIKNVIAKNDQLQERHENANVEKENTTNIKLEADAYQLRLENLKNRETAVKMREERLSIKEHQLHKREKKVALMERTVKEKMLHAELYLKRCRESTRSTSSGSSKSCSTRAKVNYEHIDTSFSADCGDSSIIIPTSKKMNSENIKKPHNFIRTLSERRVQFKGHSPLKDMFGRNNPKEARILHQPSLHHMTIHETSSTTGSETTEGNSIKSDLTSTTSDLTSTNTLPQKKSKSRKKLELSLVLPARNRKPLVDKNVIYEEKEATTKQTEYRPISWTEESKQHAFELLRIMNQNNGNEVVKHTYL